MTQAHELMDGKQADDVTCPAQRKNCALIQSSYEENEDDEQYQRRNAQKQWESGAGVMWRWAMASGDSTPEAQLCPRDV
ncbi:hypothetical protein IFM47457_01116 [Aspergillus lentulus]|nr:hypothetical protein IFM47457_01116 [Aspergillus lentulus]